jgi:hypothetical protein
MEEFSLFFADASTLPDRLERCLGLQLRSRDRFAGSDSIGGDRAVVEIVSPAGRARLDLLRLAGRWRIDLPQYGSL